MFRMSTSKSTDNTPIQNAENNAVDSQKQQEQQEQQPQEQQMSEKEKSLLEENKKLIDLLSDVDDKYKRALADGENTRIRMLKQIEEAKIFGIQKFSKDLLEVADILNMAIEAVPKEALNDNKHNVLKNLFEGVKMTEQQLQNVFKRHGLTQMNPIGEKFNPNEHHAMIQVEQEGKEPGTVAFVTKIGYKLQDRVIRPAMVGVVKSNT